MWKLGKNKGVASKLTPKDNKVKGILILFCMLSFFFVSACMPLNNEHINTELFKNKEELKTKIGQLERGMKKNKVFEHLNIPIEKFEQLNTEQIQMAIYGNSQVQGSPEQLEKFKKKLLAYQGYALNYRKIKSKGSLGLGKMKINKKGHNLRILIIFEKNKLLKAAVEGQNEVDQNEDQYLWNSILKTGVKTAF